MLPANYWTAIDNALLGLLFAVVSGLLLAAIPPLLRWLNERVASIKDARLRALAQTIVQGLEQGLQDAAGPEKKVQAAALLRAAFPDASTQAINMAVESAVLVLHRALPPLPSSITLGTVTTTTAAPATWGRRADDPPPPATSAKSLF